MLNLHAYCDSDWANCPGTRRSTSCFIAMLAGAAVSWVSKRQPTVALSTAEAECTTACLAAQEVQWIRQALAEIGAPISKEPTTVHADSQSAIHMCNNPTAGRAKHIDIKMHFVKEAQERGVVNFIPTSQEAAAILTEAPNRPKIIKFRNTIHGDIEAATISASIYINKAKYSCHL